MTIYPMAMPRRAPFFLILNLLTLFGVVLGFGPFFYWRDSTALGPQTLVLLWHGVIYTAWFLLIVIQSFLIRRGQLALHKTLGLASIGLTIAMLISACLAADYAYGVGTTAGPLNREGFQFLIFSDLLVFTLLYGLALKDRKRTENHKRYMVLASISLLLPALGRLFATLGLPGEGGLLTLCLMAGSVGLFDWLSKKRLYKATQIGLALILIKILVTLPVGQSPQWAALVKALYGSA